MFTENTKWETATAENLGKFKKNLHIFTCVFILTCSNGDPGLIL